MTELFSELSTTFYIITLCSAAYSLFSQYVTHRFGNRQRIKEIQKEMADINKRYAEAMKSNDDARMKKAEKDQARIPSLMMESMKYQFKPLLILLPVLFVFPTMLRSQFPHFQIVLPFDIPILIQHFERFPNWRNTFGTYGWFWVAVVFISLFSSLIVSAYKKLRGKP